MTDWIKEREDAAAARVSALLALPLPESPEALGSEEDFNPWKVVFPAVYGSYCGAFDKCAIEVLEELRDHDRRREDLGADMLREMLCVADLCSYGTSPRVCFPTQQFEALLPALIEKWRAYAISKWDGWDPKGET